MDRVDKEYLPPSDRAAIVWHALQEGYALLAMGKANPFDVFAFACEFVGQMSLAIQHDHLTALSRELLKWYYTAHYNHPDDLHGEPDLEKWQDLLNRLDMEVKDGLLKERGSSPSGRSHPESTGGPEDDGRTPVN